MKNIHPLKRFRFVFCLLCITHTVPAQVIPPGLGDTRTASWFALSFKQDLGAPEAKDWQSVTYLGAGTMSNPDSRNPFDKPAIFIVNQEFKKRFQQHWEYTLAVSYRRQNEYADDPPYEKSDPAIKQEFRLYGRLSYTLKFSSAEITPALRQEIQRYYTPGFHNFPEIMRLRSRFRLKFSIPVDKDKKHRILLFSEQLFSTSQMNSTKQWTRFRYQDSRFSLYYSWSPADVPLTFNVGYMNNLKGTKSPVSIHHFGLDISWHNPFQRRS